MVANELTALPGALEALRAIATLAFAGFVPGFLALKILHPEAALPFFERIASSVFVSILILALAGILLVFSFGLRDYSLFLAVAAIVAIEWVYLKK